MSRVVLIDSGGCNIGYRPIGLHLQGLEALGADSADSGPRRRLPDPSALDPEAEAGEREAFAALLVGVREHARLSEDSKRVLGEGFLDEASFEGKVVGGVAELAAELAVPVLAVVGQVYDDVEDRVPVVSLVDRFGDERARADTAACITEVVAAHLAGLDR